MKKIYNDYFCISENEKIKDKVMIARLASTCIIVISCLLAMSLMAYAFFLHLLLLKIRRSDQTPLKQLSLLKILSVMS